MNIGIIDLIVAVAVAASALAVFAMCAVGIVVWFAGAERRKAGERERNPERPPPGE